MRLQSSLLALALLLAPSAAFALAIGDPIPMKDTALQNSDGHDIRIADLAASKGTLVVFTCNHCPYSKAWEGRIVAIGNDWSKRGFGVIAINSNDPSANDEDGLEQTKARASEKGFAFPYAVDSTSGVAKAFGASRTPEVFLFDAGGKLAYHGAVDDSGEPAKVTAHYLTDALEAVLAGKAPTPAETKALGCGIKFR